MPTVILCAKCGEPMADKWRYFSLSCGIVCPDCAEKTIAPTDTAAVTFTGTTVAGDLVYNPPTPCIPMAERLKAANENIVEGCITLGDAMAQGREFYERFEAKVWGRPVHTCAPEPTLAERFRDHVTEVCEKAIEETPGVLATARFDGMALEITITPSAYDYDPILTLLASTRAITDSDVAASETERLVGMARKLVDAWKELSK